MMGMDTSPLTLADRASSPSGCGVANEVAGLWSFVSRSLRQDARDVGHGGVPRLVGGVGNVDSAPWASLEQLRLRVAA